MIQDRASVSRPDLHGIHRRRFVLGGMMLGLVGGGVTSQVSFAAPTSQSDYERVERVGYQILPPPSVNSAWSYVIPTNTHSAFARRIGRARIAVSSPMIALCDNDGQLAASLLFAVLRRTDAANDRRVISTLAQKGYDPREALIIAQKLERTQSKAFNLGASRWQAMEIALAELGYRR